MVSAERSVYAVLGHEIRSLMIFGCGGDGDYLDHALEKKQDYPACVLFGYSAVLPGVLSVMESLETRRLLG